MLNNGPNVDYVIIYKGFFLFFKFSYQICERYKPCVFFVVVALFLDMTESDNTVCFIII